MKRFGKYLLHERIAAGGMAEVFKGTLPGDAGFERQVAIKCILPQLGEDREFVSMFIDEAKIAVQLQHANIVQILDLGCHDGTYFIAMEYVNGHDCRSILQRERAQGRAVPVAFACHVAMKVAHALHHAHNAMGREGRPLGVIHRDISPQNVLVSFDGEVKVVDFGLAKAAGRATQTQAGVVKGKLAYLSPEQAHGQEVDGRSDIYSLGLVLFELLTGRRMFDRPNDLDTIMAVRAGEVVPLRAVAPDMPPHLEAILSRALERDPQLRYQTAMDLHDDLEVFAYDKGELVTRKDVAEYVRGVFGYDAGFLTTMVAAPGDPDAGDTIPAPPPDAEEETEEPEDTEVSDERRDTLITELKPDEPDGD